MIMDNHGKIVMMPAGKNSLLVLQSSLAVLQQSHLRASRRNGRKEREFGLVSISFILASNFYVP
jgi:hypothetical protein